MSEILNDVSDNMEDEELIAIETDAGNNYFGNLDNGLKPQQVRTQRQQDDSGFVMTEEMERSLIRKLADAGRLLDLVEAESRANKESVENFCGDRKQSPRKQKPKRKHLMSQNCVQSRDRYSCGDPSGYISTKSDENNIIRAKDTRGCRSTKFEEEGSIRARDTSSCRSTKFEEESSIRARDISGCRSTKVEEESSIRARDTSGCRSTKFEEEGSIRARDTSGCRSTKFEEEGSIRARDTSGCRSTKFEEECSIRARDTSGCRSTKFEEECSISARDTSGCRSTKFEEEGSIRARDTSGCRSTKVGEESSIRARDTSGCRCAKSEQRNTDNIWERNHAASNDFFDTTAEQTEKHDIELISKYYFERVSADDYEKNSNPSDDEELSPGIEVESSLHSSMKRKQEVSSLHSSLERKQEGSSLYSSLERKQEEPSVHSSLECKLGESILHSMEESKHPFSQSSDTSDLRLMVEGRPLYVSRVVLSLVSPVLKRLLSTQNRSDGIEFHLPDKKYSDVVQFLLCVYPNILAPVTEENVGTILQLADEFHVKRLMSQCEQFLIDDIERKSPKPHPEKVVKYLNISDKFGLFNLQKATFQTAAETESELLENVQDFWNLPAVTTTSVFIRRLKLLELVYKNIRTKIKELQNQCSLYHKGDKNGDAVCSKCYATLGKHVQSEMKQM